MNASPLLHEYLKTGTASEHRAIESTMPVMNPAFGFDDYREILKHLYGFYLPYENQIDAAIGTKADALDWQRRRKINWLRADLSKLGLQSHDLAALPVFQGRFDFESFAQIAGAMYVTEGSTLGGSFISKHLAEKFIDRRPPLDFFSSHREETGKMWRGFLSTINAEVGADEFDLALGSARKTFLRLNQWLGERQASTIKKPN